MFDDFFASAVSRLDCGPGACACQVRLYLLCPIHTLLVVQHENTPFFALDGGEAYDDIVIMSKGMRMIKCSNCGAPVQSKFCGECGTRANKGKEGNDVQDRSMSVARKSE